MVAFGKASSNVTEAEKELKAFPTTGGRRTTRSLRKNRRTKRSKRSKRSKQTKRKQRK
jgi:hypothetical protein